MLVQALVTQDEAMDLADAIADELGYPIEGIPVGDGIHVDPIDARTIWHVAPQSAADGTWTVALPDEVLALDGKAGIALSPSDVTAEVVGDIRLGGQVGVDP